MTKHLQIIACIVAAFTGGPFVSAETYLTEDQALKLAFQGKTSRHYRAVPDALKTELKKFLPDSEVPASFNYWRGVKATEAEGYAIIDDVIGKHRPITFLLALDRQKKIKFVEVMAYRETRGGEVRGKNWRQQFEGKGVNDILRVGDTIRNISGATLSCRSLTRAIRKNLLLAESLIKSEGKKTIPQKEGRTQGGIDSISRIRYAMGTSLDIQIPLNYPEAQRQELYRKLFFEAKRLNYTFSTWQPHTEARLFNEHGQGAFYPTSDFLALTRELKQIHRQTPFFDPSLGPVARHWRGTPDEAALQMARRQSLFQNLLITADGKMIKQAPVELDFNASAKGYFLKVAKRHIAKSPIRRVLINFGGQILAVGGGWEASIEGFASEPIPLLEESVSTTAISQKGRHIINPVSLRPATDFQSVTIFHPDPLWADTLSTAVFAMDHKSALWFLKEQRLKYVARQKDGRVIFAKSLEPYFMSLGSSH